jgi:hypothetical protein
MTQHQRYHIEIKKTPNIIEHPYRFRVKVNRLNLAKLLFQEFFHYRGNMEVVLSRPCVYGVFSGPLGGFAPRESLCVGCLRCTTQYPETVKILKNPERNQLGDEYFTPEQVDTGVYEAETGRVPVKGAGYRGRFGGEGWDGMWTDMSEIVRPTRDGIHGREFISTEVDMGEKPPFLEYDERGRPIGPVPHTVTMPIPLLFDILPTHSDEKICQILSKAAHQLQSFAVVPFETLSKWSLKESSIIPLVTLDDFSKFKNFGFEPLMLEITSWSEAIFRDLRYHFPKTLPILRTDFEHDDLIACFEAGARIFHLCANYHGRGKSGRFVLELIREAHLAFVKRGCRDQVTLIGSGGIVAAEHLPKAIICGLDAVAIDTAALVALQARFKGPCKQFDNSSFELPRQLEIEWGKQRLKNLAGSWRDQLFEVLGAMGLREVRRLRGEMGRAMFQKNLENEAFEGIEGYETQ